MLCSLLYLLDCECQIEAITQDVTAQGSISNIDALNIRVENQVCNICLCFFIGQKTLLMVFNTPAKMNWE